MKNATALRVSCVGSFVPASKHTYCLGVIAGLYSLHSAVSVLPGVSSHLIVTKKTRRETGLGFYVYEAGVHAAGAITRFKGLYYCFMSFSDLRS